MSLESTSAAIDFSTDELALVVATPTGEVTTRRVSMPPRDSSRIASWLTSELRNLGLSVADVENWTCGTGPGSFTALRCVAALTAGFASSGHGIEARGVPSALALASKAAESNPEAAKFAVLYDGRRGEVLALPVFREDHGFSLSGGSAIFAVNGENDSNLLDFDVLTSSRKEEKAIESVLSNGVFDKIEFINEFPVERLLSIDDPKWNFESLLDPIYLRPATHAAPVAPRKMN